MGSKKCVLLSSFCLRLHIFKLTLLTQVLRTRLCCSWKPGHAEAARLPEPRRVSRAVAAAGDALLCLVPLLGGGVCTYNHQPAAFLYMGAKSVLRCRDGVLPFYNRNTQLGCHSPRAGGCVFTPSAAWGRCWATLLGDIPLTPLGSQGKHVVDKPVRDQGSPYAGCCARNCLHTSPGCESSDAFCHRCRSVSHKL